jgi:hypothetical protein
MDTDRVQEIDRKIKRYEGIDELLNRCGGGKDGDAAGLKETGAAAPGDSPEGKNEQG